MVSAESWLKERLNSSPNSLYFKSDDSVFLVFNFYDDKKQIHFDYLTSGENFPREFAANKIYETLQGYSDYELLTKVESDDNKKLSMMRELGFEDSFSVLKMKREMDKTVDIMPSMHPGLSYRFLDVYSELKLWYELTVTGYKGAPEFRGFTFDSWKNSLKDGNGELNLDEVENKVVVLELNSSPIGIFAMGGIDRKNNDGDVVVLGLNQDYRGKGYGELLMRLYFYYEVARGGETSNLYVSSENISALNLYRKLGYSMIQKVWTYQKYKESFI